jgi:hypothetical protein
MQGTFTYSVGKQNENPPVTVIYSGGSKLNRDKWKGRLKDIEGRSDTKEPASPQDVAAKVQKLIEQGNNGLGKIVCGSDGWPLDNGKQITTVYDLFIKAISLSY